MSTASNTITAELQRMQELNVLLPSKLQLTPNKLHVLLSKVEKIIKILHFSSKSEEKFVVSVFITSIKELNHFI